MRSLSMTAVVAILLFSCSADEPAVKTTDSEAAAAAMAVLDAFLAAFNKRDIQAVEQTYHFPHYRIASGKVSILEEPGTFPNLFKRFTSANPDWHHSAWQRREVIHAGPSKVHIDTRFVRYRQDRSVIAAFDSLYIVTKQDGRWGIKARSSFAP